MTVDFDLLQALFWSATYVLIIIFNIKYRSLGIPPIAMATNFAWETTALIRYGSVIHIAWFSLDLIIIITYFMLCKPVYLRHKFYLPILYVVELTVFYVVFEAGGMLLSSFIIDCTMAIEYLIYIYIYGRRKATNTGTTASCCPMQYQTDWRSICLDILSRVFKDRFCDRNIGFFPK